MSDARISTGLPSHPKTKKLMRRLGAAGPWALVCLFLWARDNRSDGDLCGMTDEDIELASDWTGDDGALVAALVSVGFLDGDESSRSIHDWASHQPWSAGADARSQSSKWAALCKRYGRDEAAQRMPEYANRMRPACDPHAELCDPHASPTDPQCPASASVTKSKDIAPNGAVGVADDKPKKSDRLTAVTEQAISAFNGALSIKAGGLLSAVTMCTDKRKAQVRRTVKLAAMACERLYGSPTVTPEFWQQYFEEVSRDDFKSGRGPYVNGHANWRPDFEYLTRPEVVEKVIDDALSRVSP